MWLTELQTRYMHGHQASPRRSCRPAPLVVLFILLIAVLHGDALEPSALADRRRGLLYRQPVPNGLVGFAVQGGVQHALQSEIPVRFLKQGEGGDRREVKAGLGATHGRGWGAKEIPAPLGTAQSLCAVAGVPLGRP